jgi:hypothetical protein
LCAILGDSQLVGGHIDTDNRPVVASQSREGDSGAASDIEALTRTPTDHAL